MTKVFCTGPRGATTLAMRSFSARANGYGFGNYKRSGYRASDSSQMGLDKVLEMRLANNQEYIMRNKRSEWTTQEVRNNEIPWNRMWLRT